MVFSTQTKADIWGRSHVHAAFRPFHTLSPQHAPDLSSLPLSVVDELLLSQPIGFSLQSNILEDRRPRHPSGPPSRVSCVTSIHVHSIDIYHTTMSPSSSSQPEESLPLLSPQPQHSPTLRHKLSARRHVPLTEKAKGKQRAVEPDLEAQPLIEEDLDGVDEEIEKKEKKVERGRRITVIFSNEGKEGNLELWVEPDETVGKVKDQVSHHYPVQYQTKA
jgi:hypothetical protein